MALLSHTNSTVGHHRWESSNDGDALALGWLQDQRVVLATFKAPVLRGTSDAKLRDHICTR